MTPTKTRRLAWRLPVGALLVIALLAIPASASAQDTDPTAARDSAEPGWEIRFYAAALDMDQESTNPTRPSVFSHGYETDSGAGIGFNAEYRFSRRLGLDLGIFSGGNVDIEVYTGGSGGSRWVAYDTLSFTPLTVGLDIHLTPGQRVDLYVCPMAALVRYGSIAWYDDPSGFRTDLEFDEDFGLGARLGLGVPFGNGRWSFQANIAYLESDLEGRGANGVRLENGYDSTIIGVGAGYRFKRRAS